MIGVESGLNLVQFRSPKGESNHRSKRICSNISLTEYLYKPNSRSSMKRTVGKEWLDLVECADGAETVDIYFLEL